MPVMQHSQSRDHRVIEQVLCSLIAAVPLCACDFPNSLVLIAGAEIVAVEFAGFFKHA